MQKSVTFLSSFARFQGSSGIAEGNKKEILVSKFIRSLKIVWQICFKVRWSWNTPAGPPFNKHLKSFKQFPKLKSPPLCSFTGSIAEKKSRLYSLKLIASIESSICAAALWRIKDKIYNFKMLQLFKSKVLIKIHCRSKNLFVVGVYFYKRGYYWIYYTLYNVVRFAKKKKKKTLLQVL